MSSFGGHNGTGLAVQNQWEFFFKWLGLVPEMHHEEVCTKPNKELMKNFLRRKGNKYDR